MAVTEVIFNPPEDIGPHESLSEAINRRFVSGFLETAKMPLVKDMSFPRQYKLALSEGRAFREGMENWVMDTTLSDGLLILNPHLSKRRLSLVSEEGRDIPLSSTEKTIVVLGPNREKGQEKAVGIIEENENGERKLLLYLYFYLLRSDPRYWEEQG